MIGVIKARFSVRQIFRGIKETFFSLHLINLNIKCLGASIQDVRGKVKEKKKEKVDKGQINRQAGLIIDQYGDAILRVAYSYLHQMSDAEDILQDTIIQYIKNSPAFENLNHEKAWLMRVAINLSKNKLSYYKRHEAAPIDEDLFIEEEKDLKYVWDAVKSLPLKYSEVIHLYYQEGYSTYEISEILDKNEATIRSLLHRGRGKLKMVLKEVYDFHE